MATDQEREQRLAEYLRKRREVHEMNARCRQLREALREAKAELDKTEDDLKVSE